MAQEIYPHRPDQPAGGDLSDEVRARPLPSTAAVVGLLALAKFAVQFATAGRYGIFQDELYFVGGQPPPEPSLPAF